MKYKYPKLDPPAKWELKPHDHFDGCWRWRMIQRPEDNELSRDERSACIYDRLWHSRGDFEAWLKDRYRSAFVKEVLQIWEVF